MPRSIHVMPHRDGWQVKKDGALKAIVVTETKAEALQEAREIAINQRLQVVIHGKDGRIQKRITPQEAEGSDCFITTACVKYFKLSDDCYELTTLRHFRDQYLLKHSEGQALVSSYNRIAPVIVALLESSTNRHRLYKTMFEQIKQSCLAIEEHNYERAIIIYREAVLKLQSHLKIS